MDGPSLRIIDSLHPDLRHVALSTFSECECALTGRAKPRLTYGLRSFKEQSDLYNLGRTVVNPDGKSKSKPMGNIVTNAKAGQSIHNYALAVDFCLIVDGKKATWDTLSDFDGDLKSDWMEVVAIFKKNGWEWGGDWKTFKDRPHFQYDFGYSWQQLQAKYNASDLITGTSYVNLIRVAGTIHSMYRTTASVNFRTEGSLTGSIIMVILKGEYVTEISRKGAWSAVYYNGRKGYVSNKYLIK